MECLDVEIILKKYGTISNNDVISICYFYLNKNKIKPGTLISQFDNVEHLILYDYVDHIFIGELDSHEHTFIDPSKLKINWYVYTLDTNGPQIENCEDDSGAEVSLATHWVLPSYDLINLWENLIYESGIKENLLKYASTMMEFADRGIDSNIISCNRVILLHGPPGTGKTSLCKALAHKLSIRLQSRFQQAILVEINSHSLFSKWFSESGKLVTKMFTKIRDIVEDSKTLVCVLIDEIESLAHAREQCMSGNEPSDSVRVVNAVLTQIDQIKRYPNVIILTTSNMTGAIDIAFVDRADIKQYLGIPGVQAVYQIYYSCVQELLKAGIVQSKQILHKVNVFKKLNFEEFQNNEIYESTRLLIEISEKSLGLSGRTLRKIPFLAHALFLNGDVVNLNEFFEAMSKAINREKVQREHFLNLPDKKV